ncbi:MAG: DUF4430 domain-containing protein [Oscillospiraceae bacterium]|nr:DUF4430 domain-containing protein [Oscillospiraceae bacterium]
MNKNSMHKLLSFTLCIVLIAAMALLATGCSDAKPADPTGTTQATQATQATEAPLPPDVTLKGEGKNSFYFNVTDLAGKVTKFLIKTDKTVVGDALLELELIAGESSSYGLYVKAVNGVTADYTKDKAYWAFYVNGEYAIKGVDATKIEANTTYGFVMTPAE